METTQYQEIKITCRDCFKEFVFTANDQKFYAAHPKWQTPKTCKPCRVKRKINQETQ